MIATTKTRYMTMKTFAANSLGGPGGENVTARILVAEDTAIIRQLITMLLSRAGHHVEAVPDGLRAWEALEAGNYDLLITDNQMPGLSGFDLVKRLQETGNPLPIVMLSGSFDAEQLEQARWLGIAAAIAKPFTSDQLLAIVWLVLRGRADFWISISARATARHEEIAASEM